MASSFRRCLNKPDAFCYICGEYTVTKNRKTISEFVKQAYFAYFGADIRDQDKLWVPHVVCKICTEHLRQWTNGKRSSLKFGIPMMWKEQQNHHNDCYFCLVNVVGINKKNRSKWTYPDLPSARRPILHSDSVPVPTFEHLEALPEQDIGETSSNQSPCSDSDFEESSPSSKFSQSELNDLIRDLDLSKERSELLASRLKEKKCLSSNTKVTFYRHRELDLLPFFSADENLVFMYFNTHAI